MQNVEVYEVGKEQLWVWCEWNGRSNGYRHSIINEAPSLAKGRWAVVSNYSWFGGMQTAPVVWCTFRSKRLALDYLADCERRAFRAVHKQGSGIAEEFELWHIVDDAELAPVPDADESEGDTDGGVCEMFTVYAESGREVGGHTREQVCERFVECEDNGAAFEVRLENRLTGQNPLCVLRFTDAAMAVANAYSALWSFNVTGVSVWVSELPIVDYYSMVWRLERE